jgi:membrane protein HdeD
MEDLQKMGIPYILIILGLIVILFPILGLVPLNLLPVFLIMIFGIGLVLDGIIEIKKTDGAALGAPLLIMGIIALILGTGFILNSALFAGISAIIIWIIAIFIIITGVTRILVKTGDKRCGIKDVFLGLLILILGLFSTNYTWLLGVLIGLWILTTGTRMLYNPGFFKNWK